MIIYKITNNINGKAYIGQTTNTLARRWCKHNTPSSNYCRLLKRALNKYGKENFIIEKIAGSESIEELNKSRPNIVHVLNGQRKQACGYNWFYLEEQKQNNLHKTLKG